MIICKHLNSKHQYQMLTDDVRNISDIVCNTMNGITFVFDLQALVLQIEERNKTDTKTTAYVPSYSRSCFGGGCFRCPADSGDERTGARIVCKYSLVIVRRHVRGVRIRIGRGANDAVPVYGRRWYIPRGNGPATGWATRRPPLRRANGRGRTVFGRDDDDGG